CKSTSTNEQEATNKRPVKTSPRDRANGPGAWHRKEKLPMHTHRTAALSWLRLHCRELAVGAALALTVAVGFAVLPFLFAIAVVEWRSGSTRKRLFTFAFIAMLVGTIRWLWIELHRAPHRPWHPCAQCGRPIVEPSRAAYCSHACRSYARLERDA